MDEASIEIWCHNNTCLKRFGSCPFNLLVDCSLGQIYTFLGNYPSLYYIWPTQDVNVHFANCMWPHDYFQDWSLLQTNQSCQLPPWHYDLDVGGFTHKLAIFWNYLVTCMSSILCIPTATFMDANNLYCSHFVKNIKHFCKWKIFWNSIIAPTPPLQF